MKSVHLRRPLAAKRSDPADGLSLGERTYRALCGALRAGVYKSGDRLREEEVAHRFSVSRTPVREAFGRLLARKLVTPSGGRGLEVRRLAVGEVLELYALREILEGAAARMAAQHASEAEWDAMDDLEAAFGAVSDDPVRMAAANQKLHEAIFRAARNQYLDVALQEMQDVLAILGPTTFGVPGRPRPAAGEHAAILAAIRARDADGAEQAARAHIRGALRARLKLMGEV